MTEVGAGVWVTAGPYPPGPDLPLDRAAAYGLAGARAAEFLAGRRALRALLRAVLPDAADTPIVSTGRGRPTLAGRPATGVSVSHDAGTVAVAAAVNRRVGVDVQHPPDTVAAGLLRRCLGPRATLLAGLPPADAAREFAWVWTVQEACVKADGTGLAGRPWAVEVPPYPRAGQWRGYRWRSLREVSDVPLAVAHTEEER
ncbi:4'-phosphopantetheinyl transferase superfamily protein [Actinoplanes oblitus]|uniref:4'-phosphopantetheinyl transferase superfamily protein n=1 Tax=Actinoplanes oblitus TaxID=3040509 RepID=A0ABY8WQB6_9ACTN|nr:4'-phosphopantetheinyl transferase superfamily protein [Actinoplanes oblitus]WIM99848.1 4'-phosphopantetheinyl transferase superfamily protein [Actinoplanes oblitus]